MGDGAEVAKEVNETVAFSKGQLIVIAGVEFKIQWVGINRMVLKPVKKGK